MNNKDLQEDKYICFLQENFSYNIYFRIYNDFLLFAIFSWEI